MWATVFASVIGTMHKATAIPCQDACHVVRLRIGENDVLLCAIADGAGSASHSQIGSTEAVQHLLKLATADLKLEDLNQEQVLAWYEAVLEHLKSIAARESIHVRELACTLLFAVVWRKGVVLAQLGDGAWVLEKDEELVAGTWPDTGEYANVTVFISTEKALDRLQYKRVEGTISSIVGFTDGIQPIALNYAERIPHSPFFTSMLEPLKKTADDTELIAPLKQLLSSELITSRTDDDKTLVLASWRGNPGSNADATSQ